MFAYLEREEAGDSAPARSWCLFGRPARDRLDLEEILDAPDATFPAVAGLLHAAEGRSGRAADPVHFNHARAQLTGQPVAACAVLGLDVIGQAIDRVIGDADR